MDDPPNPPTSTPTPPIHTYHCLCTTLLLATPHRLSTLPRRAGPALDAALILPLPPPPPLSSSSRSPSPASDDKEVEGGTESALPKGRRKTAAGEESEKGLGNGGALYSMVVSTTIDRRPVIVRREDGWEKRWVWRCGRCRLGVGYSLSDGVGVGTGTVTVEGAEKEREMKVVYLLPGGLVGTREMMEGRFGDEGDVVLGGE